MAAQIPSSLLNALRDGLPPGAFRLFEVIAARASEATGTPGAFQALKADVVAELARLEGQAIDGDALRQRLQSIRNHMRTNPALQKNGRPVLTLQSAKHVLTLAWDEAARAALDHDRTREKVIASGRNDLLVNLGEAPLVETDFVRPEYGVLVSHNWESEKINAVLDAFVDELQRALGKLPARYSGKFSVKLHYDRNEAIHGRAKLNDQIDDLCRRSAMALFMTSNGWINSRACQREAAHFLDRSPAAGSLPYLQIQLLNKREELPQSYRDHPSYPALHRDFTASANLVELWEKELSHRQKFVDLIRDQICEHLDALPPGGGPSPREGARVLLAQSLLRPDVEESRRVSNHLTRGDGGDDAARLDSEQREPAVETLYRWALDQTADNRMAVVLGGFGMGKTTTVQALHERLSRDLAAGRTAPTPVYLDFRRLIPLTRPGEAVNAPLSDMILRALDHDANSALTGDKVIELVRSENCLVIFDGLDEVGNRIGREYAIALFRQFYDLIPAKVQAREAATGRADWTACPMRLLLTCRTHFFRDLRQQNAALAGAHRRASRVTAPDSADAVPGVDIYYMAPLTDAQIAELFARHLGQEAGDNTMRLIRQVHDLPGLAARPIMARFISEVAGQLVERHRTGTPVNIATIYEELFQRALERDGEKHPLLSVPDRRGMLRALAARMHGEGVGTLLADDLEAWFDRFARDHDGIGLILRSGSVKTRAVLHTELENASLLVRGADDRFGFAHTSYHEYFLGLGLADAVTEDDLAAYAARPLSRETLLFVWAIAERDGRVATVRDRMIAVLRSIAAMPVRRLAYDLLDAGGFAPLIPGANCRGFDLQGLRLPDGARVEGVDFTQCRMNGLDARRVTFRLCDFTDAILSNARFDTCHFDGVLGVPAHLAGARTCATTLPDTWADLTASAVIDWPPEQSARGMTIPLRSRIVAAASCADGARIVTVSQDGTLRIWNAKCGALLRTLKGSGGRVICAGISMDGMRIAMGHQDGTVRVWDVAAGVQHYVREKHGRTILGVSLNSDGARILMVATDGKVWVWDARSGAEPLVLRGYRDRVLTASFSTDGTRIVTRGVDKVARVWDASSGAQLLMLGGPNALIDNASFSADGTRIVTAGSDATVRVWDANSGAQLLVLDRHRIRVRSASFSADGTRIVVGAIAGIVQVWDARNGALLLVLGGHDEWANGALFSADGTRIVTASDDGTVWVWDARSGAQILALEGHGAEANSALFSADRSRIVTTGESGGARVWDARSGAQMLALQSDAISSASFSVDGARIVTAGWDGTVRVWDAHSGVQVLALEGHRNMVSTAWFSLDGAWIVTGGADGTALVWDAHTGEQALELNGHERGVMSASFSADGTRIVTGSTDWTARVWDAQSGAQILVLKGHDGWVQSAWFSADGARIVTGSDDATARVWDARSGAHLLTLEGHGSEVRSASFSADGMRIVTGSVDGTARVWDARSGAPVLTLVDHGAAVLSASFSPDGTRIVTASSDGSVRIWEAHSGAIVACLVALPESWAVLDAAGRIVDHGPDIWRYAA